MTETPAWAVDFETIQAIRLKVVEASPDAKIVINSAGVIVDLNEEAELVFGYARDDLYGKPIEFLLPEAVRSGHEGHVREYFKSPRRRSMGVDLNLRGLKRGGEEFAVEVRLAPIIVQGKNGGVFGLAVVRRVPA